MYYWVVQGDGLIEFIIMRILEALFIPLRILQAIAGGPGVYGTYYN